MGLPMRGRSPALESGHVDGFKRVVVEEGIRDASTSQLGIEPSTDVEVGDVERVQRASRARGSRLPSCRGGCGSRRASARGRRPLAVRQRASRVERRPGRSTSISLFPRTGTGPSATTWVLVAGGDSSPAAASTRPSSTKGADIEYPFGGGRRVSGPSLLRPGLPRQRGAGVQADGRPWSRPSPVPDAELAIVNHESPIADGWSHHRSGFTFTGKPDLTRTSRTPGSTTCPSRTTTSRTTAASASKTRAGSLSTTHPFGHAGEDLQ